MSSYLEMNLLVAVASVLWIAVSYISFRREKGLLPSQLLRLAQVLLGGAILLPVLLHFLPPKSFDNPAVQIWSAPSLRVAARMTWTAGARMSAARDIPMLSLQLGFLCILIMGLALWLSKTMLGFTQLRQIIRESHPVKSIGSVTIRASDEIQVPFSFWTPLTAYVLIPTALVSQPVAYRVSVMHELQHHRQRDTVWVHIFHILGLLFFWNPFWHLFKKGISDVQEFACDEALIGHKSVLPHVYGSCLVSAAEQYLNSHRPLIGTIGMAAGASGATLKRRIERMFDYKTSQQGPWMGWMVGTCAFFMLVGAAFGSQGWIQDRRITRADADRMAANARNEAFPIVVNDAVLAQLNRYLGTPDGRVFIRESLARMETYRAVIEGKIQAYGLPIELMAIPIVESGYKNFVHARAAGLWMFIKESARHYGLRVDDQVDERLNVDLETDAAMRYLGANHLRFKDWLLSVLAYNVGESRVQRGIDATGSRDAWKLDQAGFDNDHDYLARVMAAVLILKNPQALN